MAAAKTDQGEIYFRALCARDPRFDGKFFTGVRTTGIYCRPICPAKPKRENVTFFRTALEAEQAGFRPCLRCRPESAPRSPVWIGKSAVVQRALRVLQSRETLAFNEDEFAENFGVTARHLRRLFMEEIGKTPRQISNENRLALARKLLAETALSISEVAFASGFRSLRRFNDAFKLRFSRSPNELRRKRRTSTDALRVTIPYRPPFHFAALLRTYAAHRVGDLEWFTENKMHRIVAHNGKVGTIAVSDDAPNSRVVVEIDFPDTSSVHTILARVRTLFDLDSDPVLVANRLETDRKTRTLLAKFPGIRLPSGWDPFEVAVATILGQLVSVERGRSLVHDLVEMLGVKSGLVRDGRPVRLFPTPLAIFRGDLSGLKTTSARKRTLQEFAKRIHDREISLEPTQDSEVFSRRVQEIPGIGPWTASYMALRALRDPDAFPATDLILARALQIHSPQALEKMRPWRAYAAALYWREYAQTKEEK